MNGTQLMAPGKANFYAETRRWRLAGVRWLLLKK